MAEKDLHRDNHYVHQGYLKRWLSADNRLWVYRVLVSHPDVPLWKPCSAKGVAYHSHLYTRIVAGKETDEFERWLDKEFEAPAEEPLRKATSGSRLSPEDWKRLIRFVAAQDIRPPARYIEHITRWVKEVPGILHSTLNESARKLAHADQKGEKIDYQEPPNAVDIPVRVTTEVEPEQGQSQIKAEVLIGRGLWLFSMRHLLTKTVAVLEKYRWTIFSAPNGIDWLTSDDPVVRLNYYKTGAYDFHGGWSSPGTEILLPLSPHYLLYTRVGDRRPPRDEFLRGKATFIRRILAEHAHRLIFSGQPDAEVVKLRPRIVDPIAFKNENDQWRKWHEEQATAESNFRRGL